MNDDDVLVLYLREVADIPPLSEFEEAELWQQSKSAAIVWSDHAKRRLLESKLALVVSIAKRYLSSGIPMVELIQEGNIGLNSAVNSFTETSGGRFPAHAALCIESAIRNAVAKLESKK